MVRNLSESSIKSRTRRQVIASCSTGRFLTTFLTSSCSCALRFI